VFRRFALDRPALLSVVVQRLSPPELADEFRAAAAPSQEALRARVARLEAAGLLGGRAVRDATPAFPALCEGLAALELRGAMATGQEKRRWRSALSALVAGLAAAT